MNAKALAGLKGTTLLSQKRVASIEDHSERLTTAVTERIRRDPELACIGRLRDSELREIGYELLHNLGAWLSGENRDAIANRYEEIGRRRFAEQIPLHECVRSLHLVKYETVDFIRNQGFPQTSLEIYAEEELEHRLNRSVDSLVYHMVRGYEAALRNPRRKAQDAIAR
jgi:hypothetical protein